MRAVVGVCLLGIMVGACTDDDGTTPDESRAIEPTATPAPSTLGVATMEAPGVIYEAALPGELVAVDGCVHLQLDARGSEPVVVVWPRGTEVTESGGEVAVAVGGYPDQVLPLEEPVVLGGGLVDVPELANPTFPRGCDMSGEVVATSGLADPG